jgi:hypothetical protein
MTPIAPHMSAFLRERLPLQRGASEHTCDSYAYAFQLLFQCASARLQMTPSALALEQLDAPRIMEFLYYLATERHHSPRPRNARLVASKSFMPCIEDRVPALREHSRVFSPFRPRKPRPDGCSISRARRGTACCMCLTCNGATVSVTGLCSTCVLPRGCRWRHWSACLSRPWSATRRPVDAFAARGEKRASCRCGRKRRPIYLP